MKNPFFISAFSFYFIETYTRYVFFCFRSHKPHSQYCGCWQCRDRSQLWRDKWVSKNQKKSKNHFYWFYEAIRECSMEKGTTILLFLCTVATNTNRLQFPSNYDSFLHNSRYAVLWMVCWLLMSPLGWNRLYNSWIQVFKWYVFFWLLDIFIYLLINC